ncbi:hypothetical protein DW025_04930 [Coprococcus sp. AF38-1]|uniref:hypothetical protein n=1 Tax=Coprococcus sp. AF38-1 TaxID=2302943 RepID=UPI000E73FA1D|nr:hypothetical protein [Coprococcus sp. AF38-1]RJW75933.1 hypothetical protein DW025_04930 [Coprococcus sp. AF38-1]
MNEIVKEIFNGIVVAFIIWILKQLAQKIIDSISIRSQGLDLTGCWFAVHGSYINKNIEAIEIIYIWQQGEKIKYRMEQYVNFEDIRRVFGGKGLIRAGVISSYYYAVDKASKLIGCMNLQIKTKSASNIYLSGTFYEIDERKKGYSFENYPEDYYKLYRMELDSKRKIRLKYGKNVFCSFMEVEKYIEQYK